MKDFFILFIINFCSLTLVSFCIILFLMKREAASRDTTIKELKNKEKKMESLLNEISDVTTLLYADISKKEKELYSLLENVTNKISELEKSNALVDGAENSAHRSISSMQVLSSHAHASRKKNDVHKREKHVRIYSLADQGFGIVEIAQMLGMLKGEVELILNLRSVFVEEHEYAK